MTTTAAQRFIAEFILGCNNPVVRSIHDRDERHYILAYMYYFMLQDNFLDVCRSIDEHDASLNNVLKVLRAIPRFVSHDTTSPIDMTKIINSFLAVCPNKSALAIFDTIIRTQLFDVQYKFSEHANAIIIRQNIQKDILRSVSIPSSELKLPQKMVLNIGNKINNKSIAVPKTIIFDIRGTRKLYKLEGMIHMEGNKHVLKYFKNDHCLECIDSCISQFDEEIAITNYTATWKTLFYCSVITDEVNSIDSDCTIRLGIESIVNHDDAVKTSNYNSATKSFCCFQVAQGQKLNLEDTTKCAKPIMSKMNTFFANVLKVLKVDLFREMDIGALNFEMIKREVTGEQSIVYQKSKALKDSLKKIFDSGNYEVSNIIEALNKDGYHITNEMLNHKQKQKPKSKDKDTESEHETSMNQNKECNDEENYWGGPLNQTIFDNNVTVLDDFNWRIKAQEMQSAHIVKKILYPDLKDKDVSDITLQLDEMPLFGEGSDYNETETTESAPEKEDVIPDLISDDVDFSLCDSSEYSSDYYDDDTESPTNKSDNDNDKLSEKEEKSEAAIQEDEHKENEPEVITSEEDDDKSKASVVEKKTSTITHEEKETSSEDESGDVITNDSNAEESKKIQKKKYRLLFKLFKETFVPKKDVKLRESLLAWRKTVGHRRGFGETEPVISTLYKWRRITSKTTTIKPRKKYQKRISPKKTLTFDTLHCLFIVSIHFPFSTNASKAAYIKAHGPPEASKISESTVALGMHKLKFCHKRSKPYVIQRNTIGAIAARALWCELLLNEANNDNTLFGFIDEASIELETTRDKSIAFKNLILHSNKQMQCEHISLLACIVPGFAVFMQFVEKSIKADIYEKFMKEVSKACREYICNQDTHLIFINDNAAIHKAKNLLGIDEKYNFDLVYTIPYSPHTNGPIENFFGYTKKKYASKDKYNSTDTALNNISTGITDIIRNEFDIANSDNYFKHVLAQWDECKNCIPLVSYKLKRDPPFTSKQKEICTIRFK